MQVQPIVIPLHINSKIKTLNHHNNSLFFENLKVGEKFTDKNIFLIRPGYDLYSKL